MARLAQEQKHLWKRSSPDGGHQKHFLCTIVGPDSSYSPLEIHICWKVLNDERIRATNPHRVLALRRSHNLDLHCGRCQGRKFLSHTLTNAAKHCGATREYNVAVEIFADVNVTLHDGLEGGIVDAAGLLSNEAGLEEHLRATETLTPNGDDIAIWQLIRLLLVRTLCGGLHFRVKVQGDVAEFLFDITHNLTLGCRGEGVTTLCEDFHEVLCEVTACEIKTQNGVWQRIAFVDGHSVGDTITRIHHNTSGAA